MPSFEAIVDELKLRRESLQRSFHILLLGGVLLFVCSSLLPALVRYRALAVKRDTLQVKIDRLRNQEQDMRAETRALQEDPFYVERCVRRDLNRMNPGEYRLEVSLTARDLQDLSIEE